ncbi:MAG TPA: hypothetical protein VJ865_00675 [Gemmatimonadaceae bacterium]|nr:hypothetical protein [Gemmatimonadaceae bacterium]
MNQRQSRAFVIVAILCAATVGCGPPLTDPAGTDVTGTWFAAGPASGLTNVTVILTQKPDGSISGTYTAIGTPNLQFCLPTGPCTISGTVSGSNTVLQVFFELKDAGKFTGQLVEPTELKGAMSRVSTTQPVSFVKA